MRALSFSAFFTAIVACLPSANAFAESPRHVRFDYARQEGASACPDLGAIKAGVAARLGYEPFDEHAADLVRATIRTATHGLEARIELVDSNGILKAERRLVSHQRDCSELASSVELAVSIAIDPLGAGAAASPANVPADVAPAPPVVSEPSPAAAPAPAPVPVEPKPPLIARVEVGLAGTASKTPSYSLGPRIGVSLGGHIFSLGLEGQADFSARKSLQQGYATASLWTASLVPCARQSMLTACALFTTGVLRGSGEGLVEARATNLFYAAMGLRLSASVPLTSVLAAGIAADATAPLVENRLQVDGFDRQTVWTTPHVAFALGLSLTAIFP